MEQLMCSCHDDHPTNCKSINEHDCCCNVFDLKYCMAEIDKHECSCIKNNPSNCKSFDQHVCCCFENDHCYDYDPKECRFIGCRIEMNTSNNDCNCISNDPAFCINKTESNHICCCAIYDNCKADDHTCKCNKFGSNLCASINEHQCVCQKESQEKCRNKICRQKYVSSNTQLIKNAQRECIFQKVNIGNVKMFVKIESKN